MTAPLSPPLATLDQDTFENSWSQWQAKGALQDRMVKRRAVFAAVLLGCGIAAWLAIAISIR